MARRSQSATQIPSSDWAETPHALRYICSKSSVAAPRSNKAVRLYPSQLKFLEPNGTKLTKSDLQQNTLGGMALS
jgi:hypothetical protein